MHIVLVRHGESEMNVLHRQRNIFNGQAETPLTAHGIGQGLEAGRKLAAMSKIKISLAVSSTIQRSIDTARIVLNQLPYDIPFLLSDALRERSLGIFENRFVDEVFEKYPEYRDDPGLKYFRGHFIQKAPGGENLTEVTVRAWSAFIEFEAQCNGDLMIFSHATTIRCLVGKALNLTEDQIVKLEIPNATPIILKKKMNGYECEDTFALQK